MKLRSTVSMLVSIAMTLGNYATTHASSNQPDINSTAFPPIDCDFGLDPVPVDIDSFLEHFQQNTVTGFTPEPNLSSAFVRYNNTTPYGQGCEAIRVRNLLGNFDYTQSRAYELLSPALSHRASFETCKKVVFRTIIIAMEHGIFLRMPCREEKRSLSLLIKYVEEHLQLIEAYIPAALQDVLTDGIPVEQYPEE